MDSGGRVVFSAAEESFRHAVAELQDTFDRRLRIERLGPDIGVLADDALDIAAVASACRGGPLVFVRHLTVQRVRVCRPEADDLSAVSAAAVAALDLLPVTAAVALQTWVSGPPRRGYGAAELFDRIRRDLIGSGRQVSRAGCDHVLSCCITPGGVLVGVTNRRDSLADWPGGRVRLARSDAQVSRAEFKLEELLQLYPLELPAAGVALDLGASPGGWTRILRKCRLTVHAVDPGDLDSRVVADPGVVHLRTTAGEFLRANRQRFDLVTNDMRMDPHRSCQVMLDAAEHVRDGGWGVVTLKAGSREPLRVVRQGLALLQGAYEVAFARQLHHNRHEVTVVCRRR